MSLFGLLVLYAGAAGFIWWELGDVDLSFHGILALVLGVVLSLVLGVGLMTFVFYSARRGHDDTIGGNPQYRQPPSRILVGTSQVRVISLSKSFAYLGLTATTGAIASLHMGVCNMTTSQLAHRSGRPLAILSATLLGAFVLSGCVTTDRYASQICNDKGIASGSTAYNDCVAEQKALIVYWDNRFEAYRGQNS